jgi:hypothetical protein
MKEYPDQDLDAERMSLRRKLGNEVERFRKANWTPPERNFILSKK